MIEKGIFEAPTQKQTRGFKDALHELNSCLASAGIPAWVVAAATAAGSVGSWPGLAAYMLASGVAGGTVGFCLAKAKQKL